MSANPLVGYETFCVHGVVALCSQGMPIPPDCLSETAVCAYEVCSDDDLNRCLWGIYGIQPNGEPMHIADSPLKAIADGIVDLLKTQYSRRVA